MFYRELNHFFLNVKMILLIINKIIFDDIVLSINGISLFFAAVYQTQ